jgi:hypothetical protein
MAGTFDEKLKQAHDILDEFENIHNLNKVSVPSEIENILGLSYAQLEKLQAIQCAEYSYQLAQFAYYIQRVYNKESATLKWLKEQVDTIVASHWSDFDSFVKYEIRAKLVARNNDALAKLMKQSSFVEQKIERMNFLGGRIDKMADTMSKLEVAKNKQINAGRYER